MLGYLAQGPEEILFPLAERAAPLLAPVRTLREGPRLLPLPFRDGRRGSGFFLGEALVYEVWIRAPHLGKEGYGAALGLNRRRARALALLDLALAAGVEATAIREGAERARQALEAEEARLLRQVAATRLEVETL